MLKYVLISHDIHLSHTFSKSVTGGGPIKSVTLHFPASFTFLTKTRLFPIHNWTAIIEN